MNLLARHLAAANPRPRPRWFDWLWYDPRAGWLAAMTLMLLLAFAMTVYVHQLAAKAAELCK